MVRRPVLLPLPGRRQDGLCGRRFGLVCGRGVQPLAGLIRGAQISGRANRVVGLEDVGRNRHVGPVNQQVVIVGRTAKGVSEANALNHVAGYTIINDISDRKFRPQPRRREREKDKFFDWLHGKWHDGCCPCGPCVASPKAIPDPQRLSMQLRVNGQLRQDATTAQQIFPVAAVIEFLSSFVTLEPGDIISTGTPSGVGGPQGIFLQSSDRVEATIQSIGTLITEISG